jgi:trimethylamine--corrinoid protein Co-methyltransferase
MVLMQLVAPGAPVFHSILASVMDPHTAEYVVSIPQKYLCNAASVQLAHDWGVPSLAGAFGLDAKEPGSWQKGRDDVYNSLLVPMAGADLITGCGLLEASTLLVPEQIIMDDEVYHINRVLLEGIDTDLDSLALDVIAEVGPRGHFLAHKHTRRHLRAIWMPSLTHPRLAEDLRPPPGLRERARETLRRILKAHWPEPLEEAAQAELRAILDAAGQALN